MNTLQKRSTAAALLTALALALPASPALAAGRPTVGPATPPASTVEAPTGSPTVDAPPAKAPKAKAPKAKAPKAKAPKAKAPKAKAPKVRVARLSVTGTVTVTGGSALTLTVKSGTDRSLRGTDLALTAAESVRVVRNDEAATLADVQVGDKVTVGATRGADGVATATRIVARGAVTAPVTDDPVTDAPVTDAPVTDAPVTDAPVTDSPEASTP